MAGERNGASRIVPKPRKWPEDTRKFKELILYISEKCAEDPTFGSTKLDKILFASDFLAYAELGRPITGMAYFKLPAGPAPRRFLPISREMRRDEEFAIQEVRRGDRLQKRPVNLRLANIEAFKPQEIEIVDRMIQTLWGKEAWEVSSLSHRIMGWIVASDKEDIPYETVFLSNEPLTAIDIERGQRIAKKHGLLKEA